MSMKVSDRPGVSKEQLILEYHYTHARVMLHLTGSLDWQNESDSLTKEMSVNGYDVDTGALDRRASFVTGKAYGQPLTITK
jgi:hypothetical protein